MKKNLLFFVMFLSLSLSAQIPDGQIAPNFSLEDLDGNDHELYDYLEDGYSVILDFSATWCGPCWNYHQTGILEEIYGDYGPDGEDKVMVFMIEADPATSYDCIYGPANCSGGSIGDWTAGVDYPILNPPGPEAAQVNSDFQINYFPTLYGVAPNGEIYEIGQASYDDWESWTAFSYQMHNTTWETNEGDCTRGFIDLIPEGGEGNIDFEWSNGAITEDLNNIGSGTYYVTMTDNNNYEVVKGPIEVTAGLEVFIELVDLYDVSCNGLEDGMIEIEADGGTGDFSYEWSNGSTDAILMNVGVGDYELVLTDNGTDCEFTVEYEIEEPDELELEYEALDADCHSGGYGSVEFLVDGGVFPYTYVFEDFETHLEFITLEPGNYEPTVVDRNGCEILVPEFSIAGANLPIAETAIVGQFTCLNDTVYLNIANSSTGSDIEYSWYDASSTLVGTTAQIMVDSAGLYTLEVLDDETGCMALSEALVVEDFNTPSTIVSAQNVIDCNNSTAMLSSAGSTMDSSTVYLWTSQDGSILTAVNEPNIEVASSGTYTLTIENMYSGCATSASAIVEAIDVPEIDLEGERVFCEGITSTFCITENGGETAAWKVDGELVSNDFCLDLNMSAQVEIVLTNDQTGCQAVQVFETNVLENAVSDYSFTAQDFSVTFVNSSLGQNNTYEWDFGDGNFSNEENPSHVYTAPGYYTVGLKTTNVCGTSTKEDVVFASTEFIVTTDVINVSCHGASDGQIFVSAEGGLPGYTYEWPDLTPGITTSELSNLPPGNYSVIVTDGAGLSLLLVAEISEPSALEVSSTIINTTSNTSAGAIVIDVSGGTAPYTYLWSNGSTEQNVSGLSQGDYSVIVTDSNGCQNEHLFSVTGTTNVDEIEFVHQFIMSPNPAFGYVDVSIELERKSNLTISLVSMDGKVIKTINANAKSIQERIVLNGLANGVYLVELKSENKVNIKKLVVAN